MVGAMAGGRGSVQVPPLAGLVPLGGAPPSTARVGLAAAPVGISALQGPAIALGAVAARFLVTVAALAVPDVEAEAVAAKAPVPTVASGGVVAT